MQGLLEEGGFDIIEAAPAKINLALHVTGQRADGYHLLDMLVTFADEGDRIGIRLSPEDNFTLSGRFAADLSETDDNLCLKARDGLRQRLRDVGHASAPPCHIHLEKNLPIASGIGGGSADAAATLRGLLRLWEVSLPDLEMDALALSLGADVPMCLSGKPLLARGIGERLQPVADMPSFSIVLANPLVPVSTPAVFSGLARKDNPPLPPLIPDASGAFLEGLRNDLEDPAAKLCSDIRTLSLLLKKEGAQLARMSGSGATVFGIFPDLETAAEAADRLQSACPDWYFLATTTIKGDMS